MKNKTVLVTGGAGLSVRIYAIGFLLLDYKVICLDNFITGQRKNILICLKIKISGWLSRMYQAL